MADEWYLVLLAVNPESLFFQVYEPCEYGIKYCYRRDQGQPCKTEALTNDYLINVNFSVMQQEGFSGSIVDQMLGQATRYFARAFRYGGQGYREGTLAYLSSELNSNSNTGLSSIIEHGADLTSACEELNCESWLELGLGILSSDSKNLISNVDSSVCNDDNELF